MESEDAGSDEELRTELQAACENVREQIDLQTRMRFSVRGGNSGDDLAIAELHKTLAQLEEALANLESEEA